MIGHNKDTPLIAECAVDICSLNFYSLYNDEDYLRGTESCTHLQL